MFLETGRCIQLIKSKNLTRYNVSSLRTIVFSGSTVDPHFIHEDLKKLLPKTTILQAYSMYIHYNCNKADNNDVMFNIKSYILGMTETGIIAYQRRSEEIGSSGYVSKNVQLKIVSLNSDKEKSLGANKPGEICCKSPFMMIRKNHELITCDGDYLKFFSIDDL